MWILSRLALEFLAKWDFDTYAKSLVWPLGKGDLVASLLAHHVCVYCGINVRRASTNLGGNRGRDVVSTNLSPWLQRQVCIYENLLVC